MKYLLITAQCVFVAAALQSSEPLSRKKVELAKDFVMIKIMLLEAERVFLNRDAVALRKKPGLESVKLMDKNTKQICSVTKDINVQEKILRTLESGTYRVEEFSCHEDVSDLS